jgi:hypothetical protein
MEPLVARLPATDQEETLAILCGIFSARGSLHPALSGWGSIDVFTTDDFIPVEPPVENAVKPGEEVYDFSGAMDLTRRQATYESYPQELVPALDVADDGRIALMDPVNGRIIIFNPSADSYSSFLLPFTYGFGQT